MYQRRDFVHSARKLCPHESKPHVAGAVMHYRLSSGTEAVPHCLPLHSGRQDKVGETSGKSSSMCFALLVSDWKRSP